jgi:hypothetical protein
MSTIKSSSEHLTLNADGASKDIKFQANGVEKASISSAGLFTSTTIDATKLTGNLPAISGASLTNLPAGGKVLQVVASHDPNKSSTTSMTAVALSTTPTGITPTSTSNKVLVQISGCISNEGATGNAHFELYRIISGGATTQIDATLAALIPTHNYHRDMIGVTFLDSPNTTSSVTYAIYGKRIDGAGEPSTGGRGNDNYYKTGIRWTLSEVGN